MKTYEAVKELLGIPAGEPIFIIRAQDRLSLPVIRNYTNRAVELGVDDEFIEGLGRVEHAFDQWQFAYPDKVKVPD